MLLQLADNVLVCAAALVCLEVLARLDVSPADEGEVGWDQGGGRGSVWAAILEGATKPAARRGMSAWARRRTNPAAAAVFRPILFMG